MRPTVVALVFLVATVARAGDGDADGGPKHWEFTNYVKGTTEDVAKQINHEVEQLSAKREAVLQEVAAQRVALRAKEAEAMEVLRTLPDYVATKKERDDLNGQLIVARADRASYTPQQIFDLSTKYSKAKLAVDKMEKDCPVRYPEAIEVREEIKDREVKLANFEKALTTSREWRETVISGIRGSLELRGPLAEGSRGLIGVATCDRVIDRASAAFTVNVTMSVNGVVGTKEGISTVRVTVRPTTIVLVGLDTQRMRAGQRVVLDRYVRVVDSKLTDDFERLFAARVDETADEDMLFQAIHANE